MSALVITPSLVRIWITLPCPSLQTSYMDDPNAVRLKLVRGRAHCKAPPCIMRTLLLDDPAKNPSPALTSKSRVWLTALHSLQVVLPPLTLQSVTNGCLQLG